MISILVRKWDVNIFCINEPKNWLQNFCLHVFLHFVNGLAAIMQASLELMIASLRTEIQRIQTQIIDCIHF